MRSRTLKQLEMAERVRAFSRAHPSSDPSYAVVVGKLEEWLAHADQLAIQERAGRIAELASAARRLELRETIHVVLLRHLVRAGAAAARRNPELRGKFQLRMPNTTLTAFVVAVRGMLVDAVAIQDLLLREGLSQAMLDELEVAVRELEAASVAGAAGRADHVGARADLEAVTRELMDLVELLDTFNRHRFRKSPDLAAAWESSRSVFGPSRSSPTVPPTQEGATPSAA